jgi:polysaccharide biosynthesis transport protein
MPALQDSAVAAPPPAHDTPAALLAAWKTLRKRWLWTLTLATGVVAGVGFYTAGQPRIYRSTAILQIDPKPPRPLGQDVQAVVDIGSGSFWSNTEYYRTQFKIMQSRSVTEETVRRLGLQHDPGFLFGLPARQAPTAEQAAQTRSVEDTAARLRGQLLVEPVKESRLVEVSFDDANPERARQILSTLVSVYLDRHIDVALDSTTDAAEWLRDQLATLKVELEGSELALDEYKRGNRILSVSLDDQSNMLRQEIQQLSAALTAVRVRRAQVEAQADQLSKVTLEQDGAGLSSAELLRDPALQKLRATLGEATAERDALLGAGKGELHPLTVSASARIEAARAALEREVHNIQQAAARELSMVEHEERNLSTLNEQAQVRALQLGRLEIEYRRLERNKSNTEKLYALVMERSKESDLTRMMRFNNIQVIDPPPLPKSPIRPRVLFTMSLGVLGGVALGLFGAFGRELMDRSLKSASDVEQELGLPFLGFFPRIASSGGAPYGSREPRRSRRRRGVTPAAELVVHERPTSAIAEAARGVRTNLSFMSPDKPYRTFLITSAAPSEGKTTVACCLATAMAQAGHRVLLIDCDLRRPRLHKIFNHPNDDGVSTLLVDPSRLEAAIRPSGVPDLSLLLSGPPTPNPAEGLQSKRFQELLNTVGQSFDRVVLDSPPIGPVTDAAILSTRTDATVLVIRATATARETVGRALRALRDVRANLVGAILNAAESSASGYDYYPYYSRHYGSRANEAKPA